MQWISTAQGIHGIGHRLLLNDLLGVDLFECLPRLIQNGAASFPSSVHPMMGIPLLDNEIDDPRATCSGFREGLYRSPPREV